MAILPLSTKQLTAYTEQFRSIKVIGTLRQLSNALWFTRTQYQLFKLVQ